jgi:hypothetical protein
VIFLDELGSFWCQVVQCLSSEWCLVLPPPRRWCSLLFSMNDFLVSFFLMRMNWMKFGSGVRIVELLGLIFANFFERNSEHLNLG